MTQILLLVIVTQWFWVLFLKNIGARLNISGGPGTFKLSKSSLLSWTLYDQRSNNTIRTVSSPFDDGVSLVSIGKSLGFWGFWRYDLEKKVRRWKLWASVGSVWIFTRLWTVAHGWALPVPPRHSLRVTHPVLSITDYTLHCFFSLLYRKPMDHWGKVRNEYQRRL